MSFEYVKRFRNNNDLISMSILNRNSVIRNWVKFKLTCPQIGFIFENPSGYASGQVLEIDDQ